MTTMVARMGDRVVQVMRGLEAGTNPEKQWEELFKLVK